MNELFIVNSTIHDHNTRQRHLIHTNRGHTYMSYISYNNVGPRVWNTLLNKINVNVYISKFKKSMRYTCYCVPKLMLILHTVSLLIQL